MTNRICPACGWRVHHSHARSVKEKFIRAVTAYKLYRCRECDWRGWLGKPNIIARKHRLRVIVALLITLLLTLLLALYLIDHSTQPPLTTEQFILPGVFARSQSNKQDLGLLPKSRI